MEIELHPAVSLQQDTFNVLVAPVEMLVDAINTNPNLQRYQVLFVSGNYSRILSMLNRNITELDVRRAFTSFQLMTILAEIFRVRPADVEDMIQRRLEERIRPEGREDGLWPATFCLGE
jgi:hypothetical protein